MTAPSWETCTLQDGCRGVQVGVDGGCFAHAAALPQAPGQALDIRGVTVDTAALQRLHETMVTGEDGRRRLGEARFDEAVFTVRAAFSHVIFDGSASFQGARFQQGAYFDRAVFTSLADFSRAAFSGTATFAGASFRKLAKFELARFAGEYVFLSAEFVGQARFDEAVFTGQPRLAFQQTTFRRLASFKRAQIERARYLGPMLVLGRLTLDEASFAEPIRIDVAGREVSCSRVVFRQGFHLRGRWADVALEETDCRNPCIVAGAVPFIGLDEKELLAAASQEPWRTPAPRVVSLRHSDVQSLVLADADLRACRFRGAHHLDELRFEGNLTFARPPSGWRWTSRLTLAEEHEWRARAAGKSGWYPESCRAARFVEAADSPEPPELAAVYRELRKGREDGKDEPGAADFYYGEMEMRRAAGRAAPLAERLVLWSYWLLSGYGLRASRALLALLVTVVVFAALFHRWGFEHPDTYLEAVLFSVESTTALLRGLERDLTQVGQIASIVLRLAGPVLFGLAVLAVRGRIKR